MTTISIREKNLHAALLLLESSEDTLGKAQLELWKASGQLLGDGNDPVAASLDRSLRKHRRGLLNVMSLLRRHLEGEE